LNFPRYDVECKKYFRQLPSVVGKCISEKEFNHLTSLIFATLQDSQEKEFSKLQLLELLQFSGAKVCLFYGHELNKFSIRY